MPLIKKGERGSVKLVPTILLFIFLVVITISFFLIILSEREPKKVVLDMGNIAENSLGDVPDPPIIKTELLAPEEDTVNNTLPIAQFIVSTPVIVGEKVTYEDQSYDKDLGGSIVNWHWEGKKDFFVNEGSYTITLRVQDDQGAWSEPVSHVVHVLDTPKEKYNLPPIACFKATNPIYVGESVLYEDCSYDPDGGTIADRVWDGKKTYFDSPGKYRVTLTVQDKEGKWSDPLFQYIEVKEKPLVEIQRRPIAIFDVTSPVYIGQTVTYTDKSFDQDGDKIIKTEWSASKQSSYDKPGKYEVTLRVQDQHGAWSEEYKRVIDVIDSPNMPPVANFTVNDTIYTDTKVEWTNTSYDEDGTIAREQWGGDKKYMYTEAGTYDVTLTVWDDRGAQGSITKKIIVLDEHNKAPVAKFHTNAPVNQDDIVYFWDDSYDEDGEVTKVEWSGDKRISYDKPGFYEVTLTVWDDDGAYSTYTQQVEVVAKQNKVPIAQISGPKEVHVNETITFKDASYDPDGYIVSNNWGGEFLKKTWDKPGVYYLDLEVTDNDGATSRVEIAVYVREEGYPLGPDDR